MQLVPNFRKFSHKILRWLSHETLTRSECDTLARLSGKISINLSVCEDDMKRIARLLAKRADFDSEYLGESTYSSQEALLKIAEAKESMGRVKEYLEYHSSTIDPPNSD